MKKKSMKKKNVSDFRLNILFPLARYYDKLYHFFLRVKEDSSINDNHRRTLYYYAE